MGVLGERITQVAEGWIINWRDRLRGWVASTLLSGVERTFDYFEPEYREYAKEMLEGVRDNPETPPSLKNTVEKLLTPGHPFPLIPLLIIMGSMFGGMAGSQMMPSFKKIGYWMSRKAQDYRLDPLHVITAWHRDPATYETYFDDLRDQGWSEERLEVLKFITQIVPPVPDMVRFADFGAFDPKVIEMWREFYDAPDWIKAPMALLGIPPEWADKYWFSHWRQPGRFELGELHRRGQIDDDIVKNAYLTQGFSEFWQDKLLELVKEPWTRVDVRRMWDMRTISEEELRKAYHALGYYDEWLDGMVLWTKVYVAFPDLITRWKNGWISLEDVKRELTGLGMPAARVEEMIETKIKAAQPERTAAERDLTATDIISGVKKGIISWAEGVELLMDLGYDEDEADFKLTVKITTEGGSPESYQEFKDLTQKWRRAVGKEAKPVPEELKAAGDEVIRLTGEVKSLKEAIAEEEKGLIEAEVLPKEATAKRDELRVALHRAEAELARVQGEYNSLVAQWRHKSPP